MVNILISETDILFQSGLQYLFRDFFSHVAQQDVTFTFDFTADSISTADVIVLALCQGEYFTCFPELQARRQGIIIGIVEEDAGVKALPSCFQDIIFISRRAPLSQVRLVLLNAWRIALLNKYRHPSFSCFECQQKTLSPQQVRIMIGFYKGLTVTDIANELCISDKTVFTHKYMLMHKFHLRSDYELIKLLNRMAEKNSWENIFHQYLNR
ncbi:MULTISPECIES: helix-turn-helix transcriptional regulator [Enterobacter]|uniref:Helix-turn-helix transcriptional regulator n=1 Tax=Enterobacter cloacae TaxID=550 RepID=A0A330GDB9_ENTCL|nr:MULTISPECIES: LuxR C-terminal-related transcriptional regulator [Enterobacter cloacae complex]NBC78535.1 helix-turn-helix transcriptional regulator [Enterobacter asburiae]MCK7426989.1 LuxR C-terminal-related transcriptional regulator [Enterobacter chengduensis]MEC5765411.1 LuxR C-terminal-related transcriptional regulator [Enterobacter chengduensis]RAZ68165.1 helix-turn-helix transcriptional regulator [Enterobacter cloacae]HBM9904616.1 response regulator transcription factor [Enterobacter c